MAIIIPGQILVGGSGGGGGGADLPDPDGASAILHATEDGTAWRSLPFGDAFQEFVEPILSEVQSFLGIAPLPEAPQAGWVLTSTGAGTEYSAQPLPIPSGEGGQTTDGTSAVNTKWLNLSPNRVYRLRITALGNDGAGTTIAIERIVIINTDGSGVFTVDAVEMFPPVKKGSGWSAEVDGVSPHLVIVDLGGAAGQVCVKGIDSTTINWTVLTDQL